MRWLTLLLVFLAGYIAAVAAQETDDAAIEINPRDYVPLEVGNRWTYEHIYDNYFDGKEYPFDIAGYPRPLRRVRTVTIEITHTEVIDGLEYFVFSDGANPVADSMEVRSASVGTDYVRRPLPEFFWGGKKVRLSDEGILMFRWDGQDIPVYDFGSNSSNPHRYIGTFPTEADMDQTGVRRVYTPYKRSRVDFSFNYFSSDAEVAFLQGYGMGLTYFYVEGFCGSVDFRNVLGPLSATISGKEIVYEHNPQFASTGLGQVSQVRMGEGFDFNQGRHSESSNDFELVRRHWSWFDFFSGAPSGKPACIVTGGSYETLFSETGMAALGKMDFGLLIAKGIPPDVPLDFSDEVGSSEGRTYAVRSREEGVALLYIFDVELAPESYSSWVGYGDGRNIENIQFDWVYYPDGLPDADTSVQPISWGQLKQLVPGRSSPSQDFPISEGE